MVRDVVKFNVADVAWGWDILFGAVDMWFGSSEVGLGFFELVLGFFERGLSCSELGVESSFVQFFELLVVDDDQDGASS